MLERGYACHFSGGVTLIEVTLTSSCGLRQDISQSWKGFWEDCGRPSPGRPQANQEVMREDTILV